MTSIETYFSEMYKLIKQIKEKKDYIKPLEEERNQKLSEIKELNLLIQSNQDNLKKIQKKIIDIQNNINSKIQLSTNDNSNTSPILVQQVSCTDQYKTSTSWNDIIEEMDYTKSIN